MRVLGDVDASPELDLATFEVEPGEKWLLCSDGLTAVLRDSDIETVLRETADLQRCVDILVELTLAGGSPDNVTVAVLEISEVSDDSVLPVEPAAPRLPASGSSVLPAPVARPAAPAANAEPAADPTDQPVPDSDGEGDDDEVPARAELIRQDLSSRPHVLVGAASLATETGQIPIVTKRSAERRAARTLTHKAEPETEPVVEQPETKQRRRWLVPAILALITVLLAAVLWVGYTWTQTRYYVGTADSKVAIYNGVSQSLGPIRLSDVTEQTDIPVDSLPEYQRNRVEGTIPAKDLLHAEQIVEDLRGTARVTGCGPTAPATPEAGSTPAPTATASGSPAAAAADPADCGGAQ